MKKRSKREVNKMLSQKQKESICFIDCLILSQEYHNQGKYFQAIDALEHAKRSLEELQRIKERELLKEAAKELYLRIEAQDRLNAIRNRYL